MRQLVLFALLLGTGRFALAEASASAPPAAPHAARFPRESLLLGAHRGGRDLWPENTLVAFTEAAKRWPSVLLEGDIRRSADGHAVLIHDAMVDRTTDGVGLVAEKTLAELKALDAGYRFTHDEGQTFPYRGQGVTIPTLAEVIAAVPKHLFLIELKDGAELAETVITVLRETHAASRFLIASFDAACMQKIRTLAPEIATCYDSANALAMLQALRSGDWDAYTPTDTILSISRNLEERFLVTPEEIAKIRAKGILYQCFTINDPEEMSRRLQIGVDSILTDKPDTLAEIIAEYQAAHRSSETK